MVESARPPSDAPRRRRGTRAATRERLVRATLELLHAGGEAAVSTVSVTRGAGVAQSAFYQHFGNVQQCLAEAADRTARLIREAVAAMRREMYRAGPGGDEDLVRFFRAVFELTAAQRPTVELFLRHRTAPQALGGAMHRLAADLRADLARDLEEQAGRAGLPPLPPGWVEAVADNLMGASLAAVEARLAGRGLAIDGAARVLAAFASGACLGVLQAAPSARELPPG